MKLLIALLSLYFLLDVVRGHSWVQCADYTDASASTWDVNKCRAYPRAYITVFQYVNYQFGADAGMDYRPTNDKACKTAPSGNDYTDKYPKATYALGQRVCLAWPAKNHVAASCANANIVDHGVKVYRSGVNPSSDPTLAGFRQNLVADLGAASGTNMKGFQNCPGFCQNNDKAFCEGCFTVPSNLATGKYTFIWLWAFNNDNDVYSTCFDVNIASRLDNVTIDEAIY